MAQGIPLHIDGSDHRLAAEVLRKAREEGRVLERMRVDDDLLEPDAQDGLCLAERPNTPAIRKRHEALVGNLLEELEVRLTALDGRADVEKHQLVDFQLVEDADGVGWIAD